VTLASYQLVSQVVDARASGGPKLLGTAPVGANPARTSWAPVRTYAGLGPALTSLHIPYAPKPKGAWSYRGQSPGQRSLQDLLLCTAAVGVWRHATAEAAVVLVCSWEDPRRYNHWCWRCSRVGRPRTRHRRAGDTKIPLQHPCKMVNIRYMPTPVTLVAEQCAACRLGIGSCVQLPLLPPCAASSDCRLASVLLSDAVLSDAQESGVVADAPAPATGTTPSASTTNPAPAPQGGPRSAAFAVGATGAAVAAALALVL
jgi:hypothetical protein